VTGLGRLERIVDLRATWPDEARDFTPWLAEPDNIALLADFLGLGSDGLEVETVERFVGPYRADILARETRDGRWVLIENQLERTDHNHLGQILTYAAGLDARLVVWIAREVSPEHAAAMAWLNGLAGEDGPSFFALEIELWRIGESPVAPRFNAVVRPNDWTRQASTAKKGIEEAGLSPLREMQLEYWTASQDRLARAASRIRPVKPQPAQWLSHGIGKTNVLLSEVMSTRENWVRVEIYLTGSSAKDRYGELLERRGDVEAALGYGLDWQELPEGNDSRIAIYLRDADPSDRNDWPRQQAWLVERLVEFDRVFRPLLAGLP
jgi:hypothetical protein